VKSKIYSQSKQLLDKNQRSKFCLSSVKQTHFQNLKKKGSDFFDHRGTLNALEYLLLIDAMDNEETVEYYTASD